jgi:arginyl-tRNA synthetase
MTRAPVLAVQRELSDLLAAALRKAAAAGDLDLDPGMVGTPVLERPRLAEHGDWASNVALVLAKAAKAPPRKVAEAMVAHLEVPDWVESVEVAGPGFVNIRLAQRWFAGLVRRVLREGERHGRLDIGNGEKVQVEFISANPTGPLHVGNARWAAFGDALANLLDACGYRVEREYYSNDTGGQIDLLGASVEAAYLALLGRPATPPPDGYKGSYIGELAKELEFERHDELADLDPAERRETIANWAYIKVLGWIRHTLERFGVHFDVWFSERSLHESGAIEATIEELRRLGVVAERDGATWLLSSRFGDDKDRPLIRSNGVPTYFAADAAYFRDKRRRGFTKVIYVWGADHHGYVQRMRATVRAFGLDDDAAEFLIGQMVNLVRGGEPVKMSKRAGDYVTFDDLLDEVGKDPARYTMLRYSIDAPIDFDLDLVSRQSLDNPVYYVQYAHARISSVLRTGREQGFEPVAAEQADLGLLVHPTESALLRHLAAFEELVAVAMAQRAPHRLTRYAEDLAASFHRFYSECRILSDDAELSSARWWLCVATRQVLANTLALAGVEAPERM